MAAQEDDPTGQEQGVLLSCDCRYKSVVIVALLILSARVRSTCVSQALQADSYRDVALHEACVGSTVGIPFCQACQKRPSVFPPRHCTRLNGILSCSHTTNEA